MLALVHPVTGLQAIVPLLWFQDDEDQDDDDDDSSDTDDDDDFDVDTDPLMEELENADGAGDEQPEEVLSHVAALNNVAQESGRGHFGGGACFQTQKRLICLCPPDGPTGEQRGRGRGRGRGGFCRPGPVGGK